MRATESPAPWQGVEMGLHIRVRPHLGITVAVAVTSVSGPEAVSYNEAAETLQLIWIAAARASLRDVLENVTIGDLANRKAPTRSWNAPAKTRPGNHTDSRLSGQQVGLRRVPGPALGRGRCSTSRDRPIPPVTPQPAWR